MEGGPRANTLSPETSQFPHQHIKRVHVQADTDGSVIGFSIIKLPEPCASPFSLSSGAALFCLSKMTKFHIYLQANP